MCHIRQTLLQDFTKCASTQSCQAIRKTFEWHLAINTSVRVDIQQTPEAGIPLLGNASCASAHASTCAAAKPGKRISDAEVESL